MSVELNIYVEENCESLHFFDQTGKYDPKCNPTGWCKPNIDISEAVGAEVRIYSPKTTTAIVLDLYPSFPVKKTTGYEILPEDIGAEKFVSGIWKFEYFVTLKDGTLLTQSCYKLLKNDILCCIEGKTVDADTTNFGSDSVKKSNKMNNLFLSAEKLSCKGDIDKAQEIIDFLYVKCNCKC